MDKKKETDLGKLEQELLVTHRKLCWGHSAAWRRSHQVPEPHQLLWCQRGARTPLGLVTPLYHNKCLDIIVFSGLHIVVILHKGVIAAYLSMNV